MILQNNYVRNKSNHDEVYVVTQHVNNGVILSEFNKETGNLLGGWDKQHFVPTQSMMDKYEKFDFSIKSVPSKKVEDTIIEIFRKFILTSLPDYGMLEDFIEDTRGLEFECNAIQRALFKCDDRKELEKQLNWSIRTGFPEDIADEMKMSDCTNPFYALFDIRNEVRNLVNLFKEV